MKYPISKELKSISIYSGSMVGRLYPLANFAYGFIKCKSDEFVTVKKYSTPGYDGAEISTLVIEPRQYEGELPCIMFFHGGGFLMRASAAHYQIAKWYARKLKAQGITVEVHDMKGTCHGYETATKSLIVEKCMAWRMEWIRSL